MNNLSQSQQAASSTNTSTQILDAQSGEKAKQGKGRFKGKVAKAMSRARKRTQDNGNIELSALKQSRSMGKHGLKKLYNKGYLDPAAADRLYKKLISDFCRGYQAALNVYVKQDCKHYRYLQGYLAENPAGFVFKLQESPEGVLSVIVTEMQPTFKQFADEIASLLKGHGPGGTLGKALIKSLGPLGLSLSPTMINRTWSVHMKAPETADSAVQPEAACEAKTQPGKRYFQRSGSDEAIRNKKIENNKIEEEKLKKGLMDNIKKLRQENGLAFDKCTITKRVAEAHFRFDSCWQKPERVQDYREFQVDSSADNLATLSLEMLSAEEESLKFKNRKLQEYIAILWESFPSLLDQRPLVRFNNRYSVAQVKTEADEILGQPAQHSRISFRLVKSLLFSSRYAQEQIMRDSTLDDLQYLQDLGTSLAGFETLAKAAENSAWFMNLVGECLRKGMPEPVLTLGKIKVSSDFRKIWKEKLAQWGIERVDKPSPTPPATDLLTE
ncbi:hypothetical protein [Endozoicomonas sp. SCSIO W0465]|uniref:hypothetical protein n=1 Tax=Endozoicomonas sp. SCSIO W0465 TaxID=2918516 RepID=UPI002075F8C9|nr:hypothetical protein [Endozoicomonas sp. SCSIO W0465]USE36463.1 hypothetical protein MJO57_31360 [Endozoicomonas sp. SCSIO W0465]